MSQGEASHSAERARIDFDHHSQDLSRKVGVLGVGPVLRQMHGGCPVAWTEAHDGYWVVAGYSEAKKIATDSKAFSSDNDIEGRRGAKGFTGVTLPARHVGRLGFVEMDDPEHGQIRRQIMPWLGPSAVEHLRPLIADLTDAFIDQVIEAGECDFVEAISSPVPAVLTMMLLGMPCENWREWSDGNHLNSSWPPGSPEQVRGVELMGAMSVEVSDHIGRIMANPPAREPRDLVEVLCLSEFGGRRLTHAEVLSHVILLIAGGVDTTTSATAMAINWLAANPDQRAWLAEDPARMPTAIEELLRVMDPVTANARTATCPVTVGNQEVEPGERLLVMWSAANYDESEYDDPYEVNLERWPNRHLTFGMGAHRCIGLHVARATMTILLTQILKRMPDYAVDPTKVKAYADVGQNQGWLELPITFTPGPRVGSEFDPIAPGMGSAMSQRLIRELADDIAGSKT